MEVLVFGQTGQVARELARHAGVTCLSRAEADLTDPAACVSVIRASAADVVINAAAYTGVDAAESDVAAAHRVNGEAPSAMALACAERGLPFLHVSTDYVFDGSGARPWHPQDPTAPLGVYGQTKLAGEEGIRAAGGPAVILRTSWVFSVHGNNFVKTMLRLGRERDSLRIVDDQIGGPTAARDIAAALMAIAARIADEPGVGVETHHFAGAPAVSWAGFAREIFAQAGLEVAVDAIPSADYPTPARRPLNSRLDGSSLLQDYGIEQPDWRASLRKVLEELEG